jgi:Flp pilus assembly protein TadD
MRAAISFDDFGIKDPLMISAINTKVRRIILAAVFSLACLPPVAHADSKSRSQSKKEVEFGIQVARQGLWKEAIFRWEKAVELDPENASARNNLGVAYEQNGDFEMAEQEYQRALELKPDSMYIRQNYELFREAYEKRKRKERGDSR